MVSFFLSAGKSIYKCGDPDDCNPYETGANLYNGGYAEAPRLSNGEFVDSNGNIIDDSRLVFRTNPSSTTGSRP